MQNILEIKNLKKSYKNFELKDINLSVPSGYIMGLIGENGAGKSTLIKAILDIVKPDSGSISVLGCNNLCNNHQIKDDIGVVLSGCNFPENLNAKNIDSILKSTYKNWDSKKFFSLLKNFDIDSKMKIQKYSTGMKMKLNFTAALSHNPRLLILDEVTSGLDPVVRDDILDIIRDFVQDENKSVLISSHILSDLEKICDYITFIHKGKIKFSEEKDKLLTSYSIVKCTKSQLKELDSSSIISYRENAFSAEALIKTPMVPKGFEKEAATIEDIMIYTIKGESL